MAGLFPQILINNFTYLLALVGYKKNKKSKNYVGLKIYFFSKPSCNKTVVGIELEAARTLQTSKMENTAHGLGYYY